MQCNDTHGTHSRPRSLDCIRAHYKHSEKYASARCFFSLKKWTQATLPKDCRHAFSAPFSNKGTEKQSVSNHRLMEVLMDRSQNKHKRGGSLSCRRETASVGLQQFRNQHGKFFSVSGVRCQGSGVRRHLKNI